jgi:hypothetical protein
VPISSSFGHLLTSLGQEQLYHSANPAAGPGSLPSLELHYAAVSSELASIATPAWPEPHHYRAPPGRADTAARAPPRLLSSPLCLDLPSRSTGLHCSTTHRSSPVSSSPLERTMRRACAASSFSLVNEPPPTWRVSSLLLAWCSHALHTELLHAMCYCSALLCCACGLLACVRACCLLVVLACLLPLLPCLLAMADLLLAPSVAWLLPLAMVLLPLLACAVATARPAVTRCALCSCYFGWLLPPWSALSLASSNSSATMLVLLVMSKLRPCCPPNVRGYA